MQIRSADWIRKEVLAGIAPRLAPGLDILAVVQPAGPIWMDDFDSRVECVRWTCKVSLEDGTLLNNAVPFISQALARTLPSRGRPP
jgi:hypothetical protein